MKHLKIIEQERKLDSIFHLAENIQDEETQAYISKLLCVRASGYIEYAIKSLISAYVDGTSPKKICDFVNGKLKTVSNLKYDRLSSFLKQFSIDWQLKLDEVLTEEEVSALNSLVSNRNNIAHGETDTITFVSMKAYYIHIKSIVHKLSGIIKK